MSPTCSVSDRSWMNTPQYWFVPFRGFYCENQRTCDWPFVHQSLSKLLNFLLTLLKDWFSRNDSRELTDCFCQKHFIFIIFKSLPINIKSILNDYRTVFFFFFMDQQWLRFITCCDNSPMAPQRHRQGSRRYCILIKMSFTSLQKEKLTFHRHLDD